MQANELSDHGRKIGQALQEAVAEAIAEHRRHGRPIVVSRGCGLTDDCRSVYTGVMKTKEIGFQILVARDGGSGAESAGRGGGDRRGAVSVTALSRWAAGANLPKAWRCSSTTFGTLQTAKSAAPITVIDVLDANPSHVYGLARSLARRQKKLPELGYVFVLRDPSAADTTYQLNLLKLFPEPGRVSITRNLGETCGVVRNLALRWEVRHPRVKPSRVSPLDGIGAVVSATGDLRASNGKLSAKAIAGLFDFSMRELASLLGRTPQSVNQTPDADSLQDALKYFERVARMRLVLKDDDTFRKWLRMPNPSLGDDAPESLLRDRKWQALADFVDDLLTGSPG